MRTKTRLQSLTVNPPNRAVSRKKLGKRPSAKEAERQEPTSSVDDDDACRCPEVDEAMEAAHSRRLCENCSGWQESTMQQDAFTPVFKEIEDRYVTIRAGLRQSLTDIKKATLHDQVLGSLNNVSPCRVCTLLPACNRWPPSVTCYSVTRTRD